MLFQLTRSRGAWHLLAVIQALNWQFQLTRSRGAWLPMAYLKKSLSIFQLTRSRGAWLGNNKNRTLWYHFNSHAHVERDARRLPVVEEQINFNSHAHVERDVQIGASNPLSYHFNSHAHVERDLLKFQKNGKTWQFQLTRSRGAWLQKVRCEMPDAVISTHTLTWSVTSSFHSSGFNVYDFNSHAHVERDL